MMEVMSIIECDQLRLANWNIVERGTIFDTGRSELFLTVSKSQDSIEAIELTPANIEKLLNGQECQAQNYRFLEIDIMNVQTSTLIGGATSFYDDLELPKTDVLEQVLDLAAISLARMQLPDFYEKYYDQDEKQEVEYFDDFFDQATRQVVSNLFDNSTELSKAIDTLKSRVSWFSNNATRLEEVDPAHWPGKLLEENPTARYLAISNDAKTLYFIFSNEKNPFQSID